MMKHILLGTSSLLITPTRMGRRRRMERQHKYSLSMVNTLDLSRVCWSQARKLNPLLNKLIDASLKGFYSHRSWLSRSQRRTSATQAWAALQGKGTEAKRHTKEQYEHPAPEGMHDLALGWTHGQWTVPFKTLLPTLSGLLPYIWGLHLFLAGINSISGTINRVELDGPLGISQASFMSF